MDDRRGKNFGRKKTESQLNAFLWYGYKKSNSHHDIHNGGKCRDKSDVKEGKQVSLGGEGGEEEADEGEAAGVGGG